MPSMDRHVSDYGQIQGELDLARKNLHAVDYQQLEQERAPPRRCVWPYGHSCLKSWANSLLPMLSQEESTWISLCRLKGVGAEVLFVSVQLWESHLTSLGLRFFTHKAMEQRKLTAEFASGADILGFDWPRVGCVLSWSPREMRGHF